MQPPGEPGFSVEASEVFRIGYLPEGSDLMPARPLLQGLRDALRGNPAVWKAMQEKGYREISLRPCDEPSDMIQRLDALEFELAFATPIVYARQFREATDPTEGFRRVPYEPILQFRRPGDIPRGEGVMRQGAVFVGRSSSLWGARPADEAIQREIAGHSLAVPSSNSAAGYIYPQIKMIERFGQLRPAAYLFCGSSAEVVKYVVSGLAEVGACETHVLETLGTIATPKGNQQLYQILFTTAPIPTDPILMRRDLLPQNPGARLGAELKVAIRSYFNDRPLPRAPGLKVAPADRVDYEPVAKALESFDAIKRPATPAPLAAGIGREASP